MNQTQYIAEAIIITDNLMFFVTEKIPVKIKITPVSQIRHYYNQ